MPRESRNRSAPLDNPDARAIRMASQYEGVLTLAELAKCGLPRSTVAARTRRGWLTRVHDGVYAVGRIELTPTGQFIAAVKACGPVAALSHRSAVIYYGMQDWADRVIDVTVRSSGTRCHDGIRVHRSKLLTRPDLRFRGGIWVVSPEWALLGLASQARKEELTASIRRGFSQKLVSVRSLAAVLAAPDLFEGAAIFRGCSPTATGRPGRCSRTSSSI